MNKYTCTADKTPFTTCQRTVAGRAVSRNRNNAKLRRYIRRHGIAVA
jgi:hypothetical protein